MAKWFDRIRDGLLSTANALGMDPADLATIISYETGGTFDPMKAGPTTKWGRHMGLIQFGGPQRRQFGVDLSSPERAIESQLGPDGAIVKYFRAHGWQPGMSGLDAYSIVNAGAPGRYRASDAAAGGAPGTVADKWYKQMEPHRAKVANLFGQPTSPTQVGFNYQPPSQQQTQQFNRQLNTDPGMVPLAQPNPPPGPTEPGGFLSRLGDVLISSAQAGERQSVPVLNPPAHFGASGARDPLGLTGESDLNRNQQILLAQNQQRQAAAAAQPQAQSPRSDGFSMWDILPEWLTGGPNAEPWFQNDWLRIGPFTGGDPERNALADQTSQRLRRPPSPRMAEDASMRALREMRSAPPLPPAPNQLPGVMSDEYVRPTPAPVAPLPPAPNQRTGVLSDEYVRAAATPAVAAQVPRPTARPDYDPNIPRPTPRPEPPKKKFDTIGFLEKLGQLSAALAGNSGDDLVPVSLNPPVHQPAYQGLPAPRGLLELMRLGV